MFPLIKYILNEVVAMGMMNKTGKVATKTGTYPEFSTIVFSYSFFKICSCVYVITLDDFCSFFRLTHVYKLIHSGTCSCFEPLLELRYLKNLLSYFFLPNFQNIFQWLESIMTLSLPELLYLKGLVFFF